MYCKKCGAKNEADAKFCTECGTSLEEVEKVVENVSKTEEKKHDSIFRRALKKSAKDKNKGALYGMVGIQIALVVVLFLFMLLPFGVSTLNGDFNAGSVFYFIGLMFLFIIIYFIATMIISVGMMKASLSISRGESVTFGNAFKGMFQNFSSSLKAIGGILLYSIGIGILAWIPFIGGIAALILQVYFLPVVMVFIFTALDSKSKDMSMSEMLHKSMELVNGHRVEFYGLMFSFIGWMLLAILTFGLLYIWLVPYMMVTMSNWYLSLNGETSYTDGEKGLSNIAIIGIAVISYLVFIFAMIMVLFAYIIVGDMNDEKINHFVKDSINEKYDYDDTKNDKKALQNGKVINMSGINVYVPNDYKETTMASYDKIYKSPYGEVYIGTNAQSYIGSRDEFVQTLLAQYATMGFECGTEEVRKINDNEWVNFECNYNGNTSIYLYLTQKNNKLYYLIVTDAGEVSDGKKLLNNIERNLGITY